MVVYCTHNTLGPAAGNLILLNFIMGYIVRTPETKKVYSYAASLEEAEQIKTQLLSTRTNKYDPAYYETVDILTWEEYGKILHDPDSVNKRWFMIYQLFRGI